MNTGSKGDYNGVGQFFVLLQAMLDSNVREHEDFLDTKVIGVAVAEVNRVFLDLFNAKGGNLTAEELLELSNGVAKSAQWLMALSVLFRMGPHGDWEVAYRDLVDDSGEVTDMLSKMLKQASTKGGGTSYVQ